MPKVVPDTSGKPEDANAAVGEDGHPTGEDARPLEQSADSAGKKSSDSYDTDGDRPPVWRSNSVAKSKPDLTSPQNQPNRGVILSQQLSQPSSLQTPGANTISGQLHQEDVQDLASRFLFSDPKARDRFLDKLTFVLAVSGTLALTFCMSNEGGRAIIPYMFCICMPSLLIIRYFQYSRRKWQYFLLDFCYFANMALVVYLIFFPESTLFLAILFIFARGPLAWSVLTFRNSLVFHSIDRFTSCAIHMVPMAVTLAIRRDPTSVGRYWHRPFTDQTTFEDDMHKQLEGSFDLPLWLVLPAVSLAIFVAHQTLQYLIIYVLARASFAQNYLHIHQDKEYLTLFRYTMASGGFKFLQVFGPKYQVFSWYFMNAVFALLTCIPGYLMFQEGAAWVALDYAFALVVTLRAIQNGASFYLDVFAYSFNTAKKAKSPSGPPKGQVMISEEEYKRLCALDTASS